MQVLVLAVQSTVDLRDLGAATSSASFFRSIGGSVGVSVFAALFNSGARASPGGTIAEEQRGQPGAVAGESGGAREAARGRS